MYPFTYHRPKDIADAKRVFAECSDPTFLSGGHTLLPALKQHLAAPSDIIDLSALAELKGVEISGRTLIIKAGTTHAEVGESTLVQRHIPALAGLASSIGDRHVRHRGTIGGSTANNDPAADYPAAVLSLGATVVTDRRRVVADDFFTGLYQTAREADEIVVRVEFPIPDSASYAKFRSPASRFSIAGVFVSRTDGKVRVAATGAGASGVFRVSEFERLLSANFRPEAIANCRVDPGSLLSDLSGSAEYRANLIAVLARRAVEIPNQTQSFK
jgi:aerobic carbon-monoxide dehydrogenase medium subunit